MSDEQPLTRREALELRDELKSLVASINASLTAYRSEATQTFVRQDVHGKDIQLLGEAHNKDILLLTQNMTALRESLSTRVDAVETSTKTAVDGVVKDVRKINADADWLKKLIYSTIVVAILAAIGLGSISGSGLIK